MTKAETADASAGRIKGAASAAQAGVADAAAA